MAPISLYRIKDCLARTGAYRSTQSDKYHVRSDCHVGNNIESEHFKCGRGTNTVLCGICKQLRGR